MTDTPYKPVSHDHCAFLAVARYRRGFDEAYFGLEMEYALASQLLRARASCGPLEQKPHRKKHGQRQA
jgi:hypothetical protein